MPAFSPCHGRYCIPRLTSFKLGADGSEMCRSEEKGPNVQTASTLTKYNATQPIWREKFHLCVFESNQVLKLVIAHNMEYSAPPLLNQNPLVACHSPVLNTPCCGHQQHLAC